MGNIKAFPKSVFLNNYLEELKVNGIRKKNTEEVIKDEILNSNYRNIISLCAERIAISENHEDFLSAI